MLIPLFVLVLILACTFAITNKILDAKAARQDQPTTIDHPPVAPAAPVAEPWRRRYVFDSPNPVHRARYDRVRETVQHLGDDLERLRRL